MPNTVAATDLLGLAAIITAVFAGLGILTAAVAAAIVAVRLPKAVAATHAAVVENTEVTTAAAVKIGQIDAAVNGKPPGAETIGSQVETAVAVLPLLVRVAERLEVPVDRSPRGTTPP
jgi:hypothetical protein